MGLSEILVKLAHRHLVLLAFKNFGVDSVQLSENGDYLYEIWNIGTFVLVSVQSVLGSFGALVWKCPRTAKQIDNREPVWNIIQ